MSDTVKFAELDVDHQGRMVETKVRIIKRSDIAKCPYQIFVASHYREDGMCRCNDPTDKDMETAGYIWKDGSWQWLR
jgi:hypothetical protein